MKYDVETLENLIKKNCKYRKVGVCDLTDQQDGSEIFIDTYSSNQAKASKIAKYVKSLGYKTEIGDGDEFCGDSDNADWLIIYAYVD